MAGRVFAVLLVIGFLLAHQLYKPLAAFFFPENINQAVRAIQYTTRGVEAFVLYAFVIFLALKALKDWKALFLVILTCLYGLFESFLIVSCATIRIASYGVGSPPVSLTGQLCGTVTGMEYFAAAQSIIMLIFFLYLIAKPPINSVEYSESGNFIGYKKPKRNFWSIIATLFTYPHGGKVRIIDGYLYKFSQGKVMRTKQFNHDDYVLRATDKPAPKLGENWSLTNNCVTW